MLVLLTLITLVEDAHHGAYVLTVQLMIWVYVRSVVDKPWQPSASAVKDCTETSAVTLERHRRLSVFII